MNRKTILINSILEKREQSASIIQNHFRKYLKRKELFYFAKKNKLNYSIYPSFLSDNNYNNNYNYKNNIKIKIYNDLRSFNKYSVLPIQYCKYRKCYVFDFPKNKYTTKNNKLINFNFITNKNKIIIDPKYQTVLYGDNLFNQIDFTDYEQKYTLNKNYFRSIYIRHKDDEFNSSDYESDKDQNNYFNNDLNYRLINLNNSTECFLSNTLSSSTKDSISLSLSSPFSKKFKIKRTKSILKNKRGSKSVNKNRASSSVNKRVSFGSSQISFYKSENSK